MDPDLTLSPSLEPYRRELVEGLRQVERRRRELAFRHGVPSPQPPASLSQPRLPDGLMIRIWPLIGVAAMRSNRGGAWRLWCAARYLDEPGRGSISLARLRDLVRDHHVNDRSWRRWFAQAVALGLLLVSHRADGSTRLVISSAARGAAALGCQHIGSRPARVPLADLFVDGWRALVWSAYEATHEGRPISRACLERITAVPRSTQSAYDNHAGVLRRRNYAVSRLPADRLAGELEHGVRAAPFVFYNNLRRGRRRRSPIPMSHYLRRWSGATPPAVIAWRLPDIRLAPHAASERRGRTRKINNALVNSQAPRQDVSFLPERDQGSVSGPVGIVRLFYGDGKAARAAADLVNRYSPRSGELYALRPDGQQANLWDVLPLDD